MQIGALLEYTLVWTTLAPRQNAAYIQAIKTASKIHAVRASEIQAVRDAGQAIMAPGVMENVSKTGQRVIKSNLADINENFDNLTNNSRVGLSWWRIILHFILFIFFALFALACNTLPIIEAGFLGETVYIVRNLGFFVLAFVELINFIIWAHATYRLIWRLTRERLATGAVTMFLYFPPAFFLSYRYLYEKSYYTWTNAGLTGTWLFFYQILPDISGWWQLHSLKKRSRNNTPAQDAAILRLLEDFERATSSYDTLMRRFNIGGPLQMLDSMLKDQFSTVIDFLEACLSPDARHARVPAVTPEQLSIRKVERRIKLIFLVIAVIIQTAIFVSLIGQWLSFVQILIYLINVSMILGRLAFNDRQPAAKFFDTFCRMITINIFTFFEVSIPLFTDKQYFAPLGRWVAMALVVAFEYIVLSKPITIGLMKLFKKLGWIKETAVNGEELAATHQ